ncbi:hypothetical protein [Dietzia sp. 179-F 9C3 NHS]|uniref:hypothetical protein n=1 Tax=Dietzia sp. 179-F 9C3 NHS TaxID=3374295 RepID=UPI003879753A
MSDTLTTRTLHVVEFLPDLDEGGIGGFNWFPAAREDAAMDDYRRLVEYADPGTITLHLIDVPDTDDLTTINDAISAYLDEPTTYPILTLTRPAGTQPCVVVERGNLTVEELTRGYTNSAALVETLVETLGGAAVSTWRAWHLPDTSCIVYDGVCDSAAVSIDSDQRPRLSWTDDAGHEHSITGEPVVLDPAEPQVAVVDVLDLIASRLTEALRRYFQEVPGSVA